MANKYFLDKTGLAYLWSKIKALIPTEATTSSEGLMSASDKTKLDGIAEGATSNIGTITEIALNGTSLATSGTANIPLSNGSSQAGIIQTTSTVTSNSGYTACPVINGVPYYMASGSVSASFSVQTYSCSVSVSANSTATGTKSITLSGYTPLGVVGFKPMGNDGDDEHSFKGAWLSARSTGSATISFTAGNGRSSTATITTNVYVLWAK